VGAERESNEYLWKEGELERKTSDIGVRM